MSGIRHQPTAPTVVRRLGGGQRIDLHRHDEHQLVYAAAGAVAISTDQGSWVAPATRAVFVPAGTPHEHRAYGETALHLVGLPRAELDKPTVLDVSPLLRELIVAYTADPADRSPQRRRLLGVLMDQLRQAEQQLALRLPAAEDPRLAAVCALLDEDPADDRSLAELGEAVGASERTLSRLFRAEFAMTFPQWRTQLRLQHAVILLAQRLPVTTVAYRCGWSSPSAFADTFRRAFGHTPGRSLQ